MLPSAFIETMPRPITLTAVLQRKDPRLPVYIVVPCENVAAWGLTGTTIVEGSINGHDFGRRSIKRWSSEEASDWFLEFTAPFCKAAGIEVGNQLDVSLKLASNAVPAELEVLLRNDPALLATWRQLSEYARRAGQEHIANAKSKVTRARRAAAIVDGLRARRGQ